MAGTLEVVGDWVTAGGFQVDGAAATTGGFMVATGLAEEAGLVAGILVGKLEGATDVFVGNLEGVACGAWALVRVSGQQRQAKANTQNIAPIVGLISQYKVRFLFMVT